MDELLVRQMTRQLKILNFWVTLFGTLFLIIFIVLGFFLYKAATVLHDASNNLSNIEKKTSQTLDVKQQVCSSDNLGSLLKGNTDACN